MRIVIIEDEEYAAKDLSEKIKTVIPDVEIVKTLSSVNSAIKYFSEQEHPDIFFSDIQLGDGMSFEIFSKIKTKSPVIFVTAYNEYALNAFKFNGIDYILKPFNKDDIKKAIDKLSNFKNQENEQSKIDTLFQYFEKFQKKKSTQLLVYQKDKIIPINTIEIALLYTDNDTIKLICFNGSQYTYSSTLEELENILGNTFYRANRQYIVNRNCIKDITQYFARKLLVNLNIPYEEKIFISKEKSSSFLKWLSQV